MDWICDSSARMNTWHFFQELMPFPAMSMKKLMINKPLYKVEESLMNEEMNFLYLTELYMQQFSAGGKLNWMV